MLHEMDMKGRSIKSCLPGCGQAVPSLYAARPKYVWVFCFAEATESIVANGHSPFQSYG